MISPGRLSAGAGTILILGGTAEARELAAVLVGSGRSVVSSLAGRVRDPAMPRGEVRVGGFSGAGRDGVAGLAAYLTEHRISAVVDATHPFAAVISANAAAACDATDTPLIRLQRPGWDSHPDADRWTWVPSVEDAAGAGRWAAHPFVTTGRQSLGSYLGIGESRSSGETPADTAQGARDVREILRSIWADKEATVRLVDPPEFDLPARWHLIRSRGPYRYADELALMRQAHTDLLVTKDSGGTHTAAKLDAARDLDVAVVVVARPQTPPGVAVVASVAAALAWLG